MAASKAKQKRCLVGLHVYPLETHFSALTASPIQAPGWLSAMGYMMLLGLR